MHWTHNRAAQELIKVAQGGGSRAAADARAKVQSEKIRVAQERAYAASLIMCPHRKRPVRSARLLRHLSWVHAEQTSSPSK